MVHAEAKIAPPRIAVHAMCPNGASEARYASVWSTFNTGLSSVYWISAPSA